MNLTEIAKKIPSKFRRQMLEENWIYKAIAISHDTHMKMLFIIWTTYVVPGTDEDLSCTKCLTRILTNFKELEQTLIDLTKEDSLLDGI